MAVEEYIEPDNETKDSIYGISANNLDNLISKLHGLTYDDIGIKNEKERYRLAFVVNSRNNFDILVQKIQTTLSNYNISNARLNKEILPGVYFSDTSLRPKKYKIAVMFPGHGSQYQTMGSDMYSKSRTFKEIVDIKLNAYGIAGKKIKDNHHHTGSFIDNDNEAFSTYIAISTINLAYRRLIDLIIPGSVAYAGYSLGEYSALVSSGAISYTDSIKIEEIVINAYMNNTDNISGWMSMIVLDDTELQRYIEEFSPNVNIAMKLCANINVITGISKDIEKLEQKLKRESNAVIKRIPSKLPYHWHGLNHVHSEITKKLEDTVDFDIPDYKIYSCINNLSYDDTLSQVKEACASVTTTTLDISNQIQSLYEDGYNIFIESGSGTTYTNMIHSNLSNKDYWAIPLDYNSDSKWDCFLKSVCKLYTLGIDLDSKGLLQLLSKSPTETPIINHQNKSTGNSMDDNLNKVILELIKSNENITKNALKANKEILDLISEKSNSISNTNQQAEKDISELGQIVSTPLNNSSVETENQEPQSLQNLQSSIKVELPNDNLSKTTKETHSTHDNTQPIILSNFQQTTKNTICDIIKKHSGFEDDHLLDSANLQDDLGIDSIQQMLIIGDINKELGIDLMKEISWDQPPSKLHDLYVLVESIEK
jgi:[acyl-carrier-protein] S-malonyltransferase